MKEIILEVGFKLEEDMEYYDLLMKSNGLDNVFTVVTHDIYYTNKSLDGMTENEMKCACIRLRNVCGLGKINENYKIENNFCSDLDDKYVMEEDLDLFGRKMENLGFYKIFDTRQLDKHYYKEGMNSRVQLQDIDGIGVVVYYDNSNYYKYSVNVQRKMLIDELNSYGFNISYEQEELDKLRTLYYNENNYSLNQNC